MTSIMVTPPAREELRAFTVDTVTLMPWLIVQCHTARMYTYMTEEQLADPNKPPTPPPPEYLSGEGLWTSPDKLSQWRWHPTKREWILVWGVGPAEVGDKPMRRGK